MSREQTLPPIGSSERDAIEHAAIKQADEMLTRYEDIGRSLSELHFSQQRERGHEAARVLTDHVEQVWIGRILL